MTKRIVVLSDGTGNAAAKVWRSNVWRVFELLDLTGNEQVAYYDDGVGTSAFKPLAILGGAFGWGLKRNVLDLYQFICRHYEPGAEIYAFGFSRGAFTIRVLLGLVGHQGLVRATSEADLGWKTREAYRAYRAARYHSVFHLEKVFRAIRDAFLGLKNRIARRKPYDKNDNHQVAEIRFVGVWDTVAAYGLPIEEMTIGVSKYLWPLELPTRELSDKIKRACHALALDDERTTFHPVLWTESTEEPPPADDATPLKNERLSQVWFPGVHSNVGGGYPDDRLAQVSLLWMMREAKECGLEFKTREKMEPDAFRHTESARDKDGRLYDSRQGLGGYYRYGPRKIKELCDARFSSRKGDSVEIALPKIHESAFKRVKSGKVYAPIGIPAAYAVVDDKGQVLKGNANPHEKPTEAEARANAQEKVWNIVWWRRVVYFLTVASSLYLLLFPLIYQTNKAAEHESRISWVSTLLRMLESVLPGFLGPWIDAFAANPGRFLIGIGFVAGFMILGVDLGGRIANSMQNLWRKPPPVDTKEPTDWVFKLRTSRWWKGLLKFMKRRAIPVVSAIALVYVGVAALSQVTFKALDPTGWFWCRGSSALEDPTNRPEKTAKFSIDQMCAGTGIRLSQGERYVVKLTRDPPHEEWRNGNFAIEDIAGFEIGELENGWDRARMFVALPFRRVLSRPWGRPIVRIGATGADEYPMDPPVVTPVRKPNPYEVVTTFRARRTGEMFLYVNDAVVFWSGSFYKNNRGHGIVTVCHDRPARSCEGTGTRQ
jgi:uncharacterized protein (DUF2235 family)